MSFPRSGYLAADRQSPDMARNLPGTGGLIECELKNPMALELEQTCWRGVEIGHPADWELSFASSLDAPGRCTFSDRFFQRLDVRWRPLTYVPDMDKMLDKFRVQKGKKVTFEDAPHLPPPWRGLVRRMPEARILHAGRFFREARLLVEATILWPRERDPRAETAILTSIGLQDPEARTRFWNAMGLEVVVDGRYDLASSSTRVGRVMWEFRPQKPSRKACLGWIDVERIATPKYWLQGPLRNWLLKELPERSRVLHRGTATRNGHAAELLTSSTSIGILRSLRGVRRVRCDIAWECPKENRVYRIGYGRPSAEEELPFPEHLQVPCCRTAPDPRTGPTG